MRQIFPLGDYVRRTGDTMTGNLNLGDNAVVFSGGLIKNIGGYLDSRNIADTDFTGMRCRYLGISEIVFGIGGRTFPINQAIPRRVTLAYILAFRR